MSFLFGRGGGGFSGRILIALFMAGMALFTYLRSGQVNPVTGEKQYVSMSVGQEKALGLQAAPQMAQKMGGAVDPDRDPQARLVAEVGRKVMQQSDAFQSPYRDTFNFYLLNDAQTVNAFALPGGQIFITRALLNKMDNEAQLAGVLGHEIGHVIHRHSAEHMAKGQLGQMLATAAGVAASEQAGYGGAVLAQAVNQMVQLKYGRNDELESDRYGMRYMVQAGYDPSEMIRVMEILRQATGGSAGRPEFMSTHPHPEARVEEIKAFLAQNYPNGIPANLTKGRRLGELRFLER